METVALTENRRIRVMGGNEFDPKISHLVEDSCQGLLREKVPVEAECELDSSFSERLSLRKVFQLAALPRWKQFVVPLDRSP